jgi:hypothetical protein
MNGCHCWWCQVRIYVRLKRTTWNSICLWGVISINKNKNKKENDLFGNLNSAKSRDTYNIYLSHWPYIDYRK